MKYEKLLHDKTVEFAEEQQQLADQVVRNQLVLERTESAALEVRCFTLRCFPTRSSLAWRRRSWSTHDREHRERSHPPHTYPPPLDPQTQIAALKAQQYTPKNPAAKCVDEEGACLKCYEDAAKSGKVRACEGHVRHREAGRLALALAPPRGARSLPRPRPSLPPDQHTQPTTRGSRRSSSAGRSWRLTAYVRRRARAFRNGRRSRNGERVVVAVRPAREAGTARAFGDAPSSVAPPAAAALSDIDRIFRYKMQRRGGQASPPPSRRRPPGTRLPSRRLSAVLLGGAPGTELGRPSRSHPSRRPCPLAVRSVCH